LSVTFPAIMTRDGFEAFILTLPQATLVRQWHDDSVAKVGGKIFALLDRDGGGVWLKVSEMAFTLLTELEGIRPAPYFARAGWVAISASSVLTGDEVETYVREAHRIVVAKLTRRAKAELGLS
jgi:predicted DNA-binding protein (MmcQ/YjbR family)